MAELSFSLQLLWLLFETFLSQISLKGVLDQLCSLKVWPLTSLTKGMVCDFPPVSFALKRSLQANALQQITHQVGRFRGVKAMSLGQVVSISHPLRTSGGLPWLTGSAGSLGSLWRPTRGDELGGNWSILILGQPAVEVPPWSLALEVQEEWRDTLVIL